MRRSNGRSIQSHAYWGSLREVGNRVATSTVPDGLPGAVVSCFSSALHKKSLSLRSRRKHKGLGRKPQDQITKQAQARETGDSVKFTGFRPLSRAPTSFIST